MSLKRVGAINIYNSKNFFKITPWKGFEIGY
jgi:hypothetical protein